MNIRCLYPQRTLKAEFEMEVPPDKSISLRAGLFSLLAQGESTIINPPSYKAFQSLLGVLNSLDVPYYFTSYGYLKIQGGQLSSPKNKIFLGNSATLARILPAILMVQPFSSELDGSFQLRKRPMDRILQPLCRIGAQIESADGYLPLKIEPATSFRSLEYSLPMASAQVKTSLLLAGIATGMEIVIHEPMSSRDHTERLFTAMGAQVHREKNTLILKRESHLNPSVFRIPGDFSSAACWLTACFLKEGTKVILKDVGLNPTRLGLVYLLQNMGAAIQLRHYESWMNEPMGTIQAEFGELKGVDIPPELVPLCIDEIPLVMVLSLKAQGTTRINGGEELQYKETPRIQTMAQELQKLGAQINWDHQGFEIVGPQKLHGGKVNSHGDHRIGMALALAALLTKEPIYLEDSKAVQESYPTFWKDYMHFWGWEERAGLA